jgi:hypothetical protein
MVTATRDETKAGWGQGPVTVAGRSLLEDEHMAKAGTGEGKDLDIIGSRTIMSSSTKEKEKWVS